MARAAPNNPLAFPPVSSDAPVSRDTCESFASSMEVSVECPHKTGGHEKKDLAALAGVNQNTITAILAGGDLKVSTLIRISLALDDTQGLQLLI